MPFCGIDISARHDNQQLCALEREGARLQATFAPPGTVADVARAVLTWGADAVAAIDAPSGPRLDLLGAGTALRSVLGLPAGRYERSRVCDALLIRRGLPLYPVPPAGRPLAPWEAWMGVGFELFGALAELGRLHPDANGAVEAPLRPGASRGRLCETYPDAVFCALLGHRPAPKRTPEGRRTRVRALRQAGVEDAGGGLGHRTLDELDAAAAALAACALAEGTGCWVGDPAEGVIVLPVPALAARYARPAPA